VRKLNLINKFTSSLTNLKLKNLNCIYFARIFVVQSRPELLTRIVNSKILMSEMRNLTQYKYTYIYICIIIIAFIIKNNDTTK
jgi:hypothetical protein